MWTYTAEEFDWLTGQRLRSLTTPIKPQPLANQDERNLATPELAKRELTRSEIEQGIARGKRLRARVLARIAKRASVEVRQRLARLGLTSLTTAADQEKARRRG